MPFLVLTAADVERLLPMDECIEVMARAFISLESGTTTQPLRTMWSPPGGAGALAWMPARYDGPEPVYGMKVLCVVPDNPSRGLDGHQGEVLLSDGVTGQLRAVLDASAVTAIRTAAVTALATRLLARSDARRLAIIGTGVQARRHLESIPFVRPIEHVRVAGSSLERARQFVADNGPGHSFTLDACATVEEAVRGADVIVTATTSAEPVLARRWIATGAHVNAIGASRPTSRELDTATVADAVVVTDRRDSLENEAGDYRLAVAKGALSPSHRTVELGAVLTGREEGRRFDEELTLYRSLGLAVFDLHAAMHTVGKAEEEAVGTLVDF